MRKKSVWQVLFLTAILTVALLSAAVSGGALAAAPAGGWHRIETRYHQSPWDVTVLGGAYDRGGGLYDTYAGEGAEGKMTISHSRKDRNGKGVAHVTYEVLWETPPSYLAPGQKTGFNIEMQVLSVSSSWDSGLVVNAHFDSSDLASADYATAGVIRFQAKSGETHIKNMKTYFESSKALPAGRPGDKKAIWLNLGTNYGYSYVYEWRDTPAPGTATPPKAPAPAAGAEAFESGVRIMWQPAAGLGYRLFRSTSRDSLGISVTDFYITGTSYADVNVKPKTTYYYTVKPVLAEARPFEGAAEKLGDATGTFTVQTGEKMYKAESFKHFILLQMDNPQMSVGGIRQEVDPGRGTTPLIISGRTMVPIRAVVEAMGGSLKWEDSTQKITLAARGNTVEMWLGKTEIKVNGAGKKMDVAPVSKNGRTFVPLRFAAENLDCKVEWINSSREAVIIFEGK